MTPPLDDDADLDTAPPPQHVQQQRDAVVRDAIDQVRSLLAENRRVGSELEAVVERLSEEYGLDGGD